MNELKDFKKSHPDTPINEWTEEDIMVRTMSPEQTKEGVKLTVKDVPAKQKVMYINAPIKKAICKRGEHNWYLKDNRKYLFACRNCGYIFRAFPTEFEFENNQLISKKTKEIV